MRTTIYCEPDSNGLQSFYMAHEGKQYYLFTQKFKRGVYNYYHKGVILNDALNYSRSHKDGAIVRTMEKLPMYIRYLEKEFSIEVLEKTKRKKKTNVTSIKYA